MLYSIAVMNTKKRIPEAQQEIGALKKKLAALGLMHPGSVSRQYQVCGNPNCRCMHPKHPERHGPFHKLSYVHRGRAVCRFVRAECAEEVMHRVAVYKEFRALIDQWIQRSIQSGVEEFFTPAPKAKSAKDKSDRKKA